MNPEKILKYFCAVLLLIALSGCENGFRDPLNIAGKSTQTRSRSPVISDLYVSALTNTSATISWKTDKPGNSRISYHKGTEADLEAANANYVLTHSIAVSNLAAATKYYITIRSQDPLGNTSLPSQLEVTTSGGSGGTKPDSGSLTAVGYTIASFTGYTPQEAVWIEDNSGNFVRTLFVSNRVATSGELATWTAKSAGVTNGNTGASKVAGTYSLNWPCVNSNSSVVSPGTYRYRIEIRQEDDPGGSQLYLGTIVLGNSASSSNGTTGGFISSLSANYTP